MTPTEQDKGERMMNLSIQLEDEGQDFTYITVDSDGVISGYSVLFADGRLSLIGVGRLDGKIYYTLDEMKEGKFVESDNLYIYFKQTGEKTPLPWEASTFKYAVKSVEEV